MSEVIYIENYNYTEVIYIETYNYTLADFDTPAPYEYITNIADPFARSVEERKLDDYAKQVGFKSFKRSLTAYKKSLEEIRRSMTVPDAGITDFDQQALELDTGDWTADDNGVWRYGGQGGAEIACAHPIMPVERLRNIDTGELKIKLAFRRGVHQRRAWKEFLADFDTVSNAKNIVSLARIGISVSSGKRAQNLVDYLTDVMDKNYDIIPEVKSVSRMGWNDEGFSPYVDGVVFDGNPGFEALYRAISPRGKFEAWRAEALAARKYSTAAKIVLAASFASALIRPLGCLPFFVHLWGMDSGTGKSVAQMLSAAVWGNPFIGNPYFPTFKATSVGFELIAGFLNSLPVFVDELQLARDPRGKMIFNVYELASGTGKLRGTKTLGLATVPTWANVFITSGETPLVQEQDGAGAYNRVVEIECKADAKVIEDGHRTAGAVKENYGHAGRLFVAELLKPGVLDELKIVYERYYEMCLEDGTTEKQAMAAALLITADALATKWIFKDDRCLIVSEISEFLKSIKAVSAAERGYAYMCDWVSQNANKLCGSSDMGEVYGLIGRDYGDAGYVYIVRSVWNRVCTDAGINATALLSHLKTRKLIETRGRNMTVGKRINKLRTECVKMKLNDDDEDYFGPVPFDDDE